MVNNGKKWQKMAKSEAKSDKKWHKWQKVKRKVAKSGNLYFFCPILEQSPCIMHPMGKSYLKLMKVTESG